MENLGASHPEESTALLSGKRYDEDIPKDAAEEPQPDNSEPADANESATLLLGDGVKEESTAGHPETLVDLSEGSDWKNFADLLDLLALIVFVTFIVLTCYSSPYSLPTLAAAVCFADVHDGLKLAELHWRNAVGKTFWAALACSCVTCAFAFVWLIANHADLIGMRYGVVIGGPVCTCFLMIAHSAHMAVEYRHIVSPLKELVLPSVVALWLGIMPWEIMIAKDQWQPLSDTEVLLKRIGMGICTFGLLSAIVIEVMKGDFGKAGNKEKEELPQKMDPVS